MSHHPHPLATGLSIAEVERDTGLAKDTLRVWERRYGFPNPQRNLVGDRLYSSEQVARLRCIRRLMDAGHRPRHIVALELQVLQALVMTVPGAPSVSQTALDNPPAQDFYIDMIARHDVQNLRLELEQSLLRLGLIRFITGVIAPLNMAVGDAWIQGRFQVFEEHFYTECITGVLRNAIGRIAPSKGQGTPRVLLGTVPNEVHGLGLLMVEGLLTLEGCQCLSLGTQTPVSDIAQAAEAYRADIVALSFTALLSTKTVVTGLSALRHQLPRRTALWVGGQCPALYQQTIPGVHPIAALESLAQQVALWRVNG